MLLGVFGSYSVHYQLFSSRCRLVPECFRTVSHGFHTVVFRFFWRRRRDVVFVVTIVAITLAVVGVVVAGVV